jgi:glycosyltransferase involved in cell wall biosynthesis
MESPLVSVLMTSYNREKYIAEAIESVLVSTYTNFELVIVDDCSRDKTVSIAKEYAAKDNRVKVFVNEKNLGDYPNRNQAASYARGKYIKFLDADDLIYYYGLEVMVNYMERFPHAGFGLGSFLDDYNPFPHCISPKQIYLEAFSGFNHFDRAPGSAIIKLDVFKHVGGFSGERMIGDYELWFRLARYYSMVKLPIDLYFNRLHEEQESRSAYAKQYPALRKKILRQALAHPDCPLNATELNNVKQFIRRNESRDKIFSWLSTVKRYLLLRSQNQAKQKPHIF